jgi:hypothetical protein
VAKFLGFDSLLIKVSKIEAIQNGYSIDSSVCPRSVKKQAEALVAPPELSVKNTSVENLDKFFAVALFFIIAVIFSMDL